MTLMRYLCPGYVALSTWSMGGDNLYSQKIPVDLWCEWRLDSSERIHTILHATKGTQVGEAWTAALEVDRSGPLNRLLYITLFSEDGMPLHRYESTGQVFVPVAGTRVEIIMGGGS